MLIAFFTILRREIIRFTRIWPQTLLPPVITQSLYFVIFGEFVGERINDSNGVFEQGISYIEFVIPGLVLMGVINASFSNVVGSFFGSKFQRNIEEMLIAPVPNWIILAGFVAGGVARGTLVGLIIYLVSMVFVAPSVQNPIIVLAFAILTSICFALGGLINGVFARKFDDIGIFTTFVLTPLVYLGGVFYSIERLPEFWQNISRLNPLVYMIDGFRYGFYGFNDYSVGLSLFILSILTIILTFASWLALKKSIGLKS